MPRPLRPGHFFCACSATSWRDPCSGDRKSSRRLPPTPALRVPTLRASATPLTRFARQEHDCREAVRGTGNARRSIERGEGVVMNWCGLERQVAALRAIVLACALALAGCSDNPERAMERAKAYRAKGDNAAASIET